MPDPAKKDKITHIALAAVICLLLGTSIYFWLNRSAPIAEDRFFAESEYFNAEISLQNVPEQILPGSIHVPILIWHSVAPHGPNQTSLQRYYDTSPESFIREMQYLQDNGYTVIGLDYLADALAFDITLPPKSIALTFDDGWESQFRWAYPVLQKHGYTATFFIYTRPIGSQFFMTWDEVKTLDAAGMTVGGHTRTHPYLSNLTDPIVLRDEIIGGKAIIENRIGRPITLFAYPYGHYNDQIIGIVKEAGYKTARSTYYGSHHVPEDLYKLKGIEVTDDFDKFVKDISGG